MGFRLRDHTADVAVEATATDLDGVVAALGDGLAACMLDGEVPTEGERFSFEVDAGDREAAVFDFLDALIYERDVRGVLPVDIEATVRERATGVSIVGSARGVPLAAVTARDVKAVTYAEMTIEPRDGGWYGYVVFDV